MDPFKETKPIYILARISVIILIVRGESQNTIVSRTIEVDYSKLADEAEIHKYNILNFLNETRVQEMYKTLFEKLLQKLIGNEYN